VSRSPPLLPSGNSELTSPFGPNRGRGALAAAGEETAFDVRSRPGRPAAGSSQLVQWARELDPDGCAVGLSRSIAERIGESPLHARVQCRPQRRDRSRRTTGGDHLSGAPGNVPSGLGCLTPRMGKLQYKMRSRFNRQPRGIARCDESGRPCQRNGTDAGRPGYNRPGGDAP
jgi:hypothetical protein